MGRQYRLIDKNMFFCGGLILAKCMEVILIIIIRFMIWRQIESFQKSKELP